MHKQGTCTKKKLIIYIFSLSQAEETNQIRKLPSSQNTAVSRTFFRKDTTIELTVRRHPNAFVDINFAHIIAIETRRNFRAFFACVCARNNSDGEVNKIFPFFFSLFLDEPDHFQQVRQNRQNYNDILESFLMEQQNQQRKQYRTINDEEFSDEVNSDGQRTIRRRKVVLYSEISQFSSLSQDDVPTGRIPGANSRNLNSRPSTSGYKFTNSPPSTSYNFSQPKHYFSRNETHFASSMNKAETKQRRMPELVPIVRNAQPPPLFSNNFTENGYAGNNKNQQQRGRRSILDFTKKNRVSFDSWKI